MRKGAQESISQWNEEERIATLRSYLRNLQYRWQNDSDRLARAHAVREQDERTPEELVDAQDEISELRREKFGLEEQLGALEDEIAGLKHRPTPGR